MSATPSTMTTLRSPAASMLRAIIIGGCIAGALDILYAFAVWGSVASPVRILQSIASGVLGREAAIAGGLGTAALGLALHFFICIVAAAIYCLASLRFPFLVRRPVVSAVVFGVCMYIVMNYAVVPLSMAARAHPPAGFQILVALFPHVAFVGPAIAFAARRAARASGWLGPDFASR